MVKVSKVLICGAKGVGKTALVEQLVYGNITKESELGPTIEDIYIASVDAGRTPRDLLRIFDTGGLQGNGQQLPKHYFLNPDAFVLVYDPSDPVSLDMLGGIKNDIDKTKEKKEVQIVVVANMHMRGRAPIATEGGPPSPLLDPVETILNRANNWCARERIKHYVVNAMERASVYSPFIDLTLRLHPTQTKATFPQLQLRQLTQKTQKTTGD